MISKYGCVDMNLDDEYYLPTALLGLGTVLLHEPQGQGEALSSLSGNDYRYGIRRPFLEEFEGSSDEPENQRIMCKVTSCELNSKERKQLLSKVRNLPTLDVVLLYLIHCQNRFHPRPNKANERLEKFLACSFCVI